MGTQPPPPPPPPPDPKSIGEFVTVEKFWELQLKVYDLQVLVSKLKKKVDK